MAKKVDRKVNFFRIVPTYSDKIRPDLKTDWERFSFLFDIIHDLGQNKSPQRIQRIKGKNIYFRPILTQDEKQSITGRILDIRKELLPQIINTKTDDERELKLDIDDGLTEPTHFVIKFFHTSIVLGLEHNQFGPKLFEFKEYIEKIGKKNDVLDTLSIIPISKSNYEAKLKSIEGVNMILAEVNKNNIDILNEIRKGTANSLKKINNWAKPEYITLQLKFGKAKEGQGHKVAKRFFTYLKQMISSNTPIDSLPFEQLKVKARFEERPGKLEMYDLLDIWFNDTVRVEKNTTSDTLQMGDAFSKLQACIEKNKGYF